MKVLVLFIFVWTIVNCVAKVELGWDESLNENDIYYAENDIHFDGNEIDWREVEGTQAQARLPNWLFIFPGENFIYVLVVSCICLCAFSLNVILVSEILCFHCECICPYTIYNNFVLEKVVTISNR